MSLRQRTRAVRARGAAVRGVRNPDLGSWSYDRYAWWLKQTGREMPERVDFCTYWRVVLLWVTGHRLAKALAWTVKPLFGLICALAALAVAYAIWRFWASPSGFWHQTGKAALVILGFAWIMAGAAAALMAIIPMIPDKTAPPAPPYSRGEKLILALVSLATLPVFIGICALALLIAAAGWLHDKRVASKTFIWLLTDHFQGSRWIGWFRPVYVSLAALVGLSVNYHWAFVLVLILFFAACFVGVVAGAGYLADDFKKRMDEPREKPEPVVHLTAEERYHVPPVPSRPSWLKRRARALRNRLKRIGHITIEVLSLIWAIIVTTKWRTCPIMLLPIQPELEGDRNSGTVQG